MLSWIYCIIYNGSIFTLISFNSDSCTLHPHLSWFIVSIDSPYGVEISQQLCLLHFCIRFKEIPWITVACQLWSGATKTNCCLDLYHQYLIQIVCFTLIGFPWLGSFGAEAALPWGIQESLLDALQISAGVAGEAVGGLLLCLILSGRPAPRLEVEIWRDIHYRHDDTLFHYIKLYYSILYFITLYYIILKYIIL